MPRKKGLAKPVNWTEYKEKKTWHVIPILYVVFAAARA
jgi:hypothetical protein